MTIKGIVGLFATIFSFILQVSPIPEVIEGFRKGDIKNLTISYFMTGIGQALFWIGYASCIKDFYVLIPNITTSTLFATYMNSLIYIKKQYNLFYILNPIIITGVYLIVKFCPEHVCDTSGTIISLVWQSTNLETLRLALKNHDQAYINLLVSFISWLDFILFWVYALMIKGYILFIPNFFGFIVNSVNLYLYFWAGGYFAENNCFVNILKIILRTDKMGPLDNSNQINKNNFDYDNTKENFINKMQNI